MKMLFTKGFHLVAIIIVLLQAASTGVSADDHAETRLRAKLAEGYNPSAMPSRNNTVNISSITLIDLDMVEEDQNLIIDVWIASTWKDLRLKWEPNSYDGIQILHFAQADVWMPFVTLYNNAVPREMVLHADSMALAYHEGRVLVVPPIRLHATCFMDLTYWPHDTHTCVAKMGSWVHDAFTVDINVESSNMMLEHFQGTMGSNGNYISKGGWELRNNSILKETKYYNCCPEPYVSFNLSLTVTRVSPAYDWTIKIPTIVLCLLTAVVFLLPPGAGEKVVLGGLIILLDVVALAFASTVIQHSPSHTPLIVKLICEQLVLTLVGTVVSCLVIRVTRSPHSANPPPCVLKSSVLLSRGLFLANYYQMLLRPSRPSFAKFDKSDEVELEEGEENSRRPDPRPDLEWLIVAAVIDRVFLFLFIIVFAINLVSFSSVL